MLHRLHNLLITLCFTAALLASCKRSTPPPPPKPAADTLVICVGGLGGDCTAEMADAIRARCDRAFVVSAGSRDAYQVDIRPIMAAYPKQHRVLIVHSFAGWWTSQPLDPIDYVVLLDPVSPGGEEGISFWGGLPAPAYAIRVEWYRRQAFSRAPPPSANVAGLTPILVPASHQNVPKDPVVIDRVVATINAL
jgi:hypothetical protein